MDLLELWQVHHSNPKASFTLPNLNASGKISGSITYMMQNIRNQNSSDAKIGVTI